MTFIRFSDTTVAGKRVFIRADLNVPQDDQRNITDDTRIRASVPCIRQALDAGARVMVTSHLGRPKEGLWSEEDSLAPIASRLSQLLRTEVPLVRDWVDGGAWLKALLPGHVVLLENCRFNAGEKENRDDLAKKMAALCDVYVNDAFGTAHRAEASTHGIAKYAPVACAGPLLAAELDALGKALARPARPLVAIVAGSKVSSKLSVLTHLAAKVDTLIIGGGIANTFVLAAGGHIARGTRPRGRGTGHPRSVSGQGPDTGRRGGGEGIIRNGDPGPEGDLGHRRRRHDSGPRAANRDGVEDDHCQGGNDRLEWPGRRV